MLAKLRPIIINKLKKKRWEPDWWYKKSINNDDTYAIIIDNFDDANIII